MSIIESMAINEKPRPVLKWAGGKQALARFLVEQFPRDFERYYEPFLGGGSVLLELLPGSAVVGDRNDWLLDTYEAIRQDWLPVAEYLDSMANTKEEYLRIRSIRPAALPLAARAAHLIYLNKTCFRGLYRVNRRGEFNVPYGAYDRRYYTPENLLACSRLLNDIDIRRGDFEQCLVDVTERDFVYFDPPYFRQGGYSDFNRYTPEQFRECDHQRLAALCRVLDSRRVRWAVSNSATPFIQELYAGFKFTGVDARREINLKSGERSVREWLITNY